MQPSALRLIKFHGNTVEFGSAAKSGGADGSTPAALVAKASTTTIPIVFNSPPSRHLGRLCDWMFAPNWSFKADYLYVNLGSHSSTIVYTYPPRHELFDVDREGHVQHRASGCELHLR
jgi:hypothetical protein